MSAFKYNIIYIENNYMSSRNQPLSVIGQFYKQIDDFKEKLTIIFKQFNKEQEIIDLQKYHDKLVMLKKANVRTPIELFYKYVVSIYAENILKRDDVFFLGQISDIEHHVLTKDEIENYSYVISGETSNKEVVTQHDLIFVSQIRQIWQNLQPNVQKNIWDYVQVVCLLSEKIVGGNVLSNTRDRLKIEGKIQ